MSARPDNSASEQQSRKQRVPGSNEIDTANPQHFHVASRLGHRLDERDRVRSRGVVILPALADAWCAAWEAEAERLGIDARSRDFWTLGSA
jgi:hypothetical protein